MNVYVLLYVSCLLRMRGRTATETRSHQAPPWPEYSLPTRYSDWATGWTVRDRIPVGTRFSARPDRPWGPPSLLYNGYRVFPGGKVRPGSAADHSPLLVPRSWKSRATPLPPSGPHRACKGITLPLLFLLRSVHYSIGIPNTPVLVKCVRHSFLFMAIYNTVQNSNM